MLTMVNGLLASSKKKMPEGAIAYELRNVKDPSAVPDLLEIFEKTPNDNARFEALIALVDNLKDPRVVSVLGPSLSSSDRQIRYLALSGLIRLPMQKSAARDMMRMKMTRPLLSAKRPAAKSGGKGNIDRGLAISEPASAQF